MRRAFTFRLYPSRAQSVALHAQVDEAAGLYNAALQERRDAWRRVDKTYASFFRRLKSGESRVGFPRFKPRQRYASQTFPSWGDGCALRPSGRLYLQGVGELKVKWHRSIPAEACIKTVSVKREAGRWSVCFNLELPEPEPLPPSDAAVGIDVGLTLFLARAQLHVANQRRDFHHRTVRALVNTYGLIAVEDLNTRGLAGSRLAKSVHDAGWSQFIRLLAYKAESAGRLLVAVNPAGTTQACSGCPQYPETRTRSTARMGPSGANGWVAGRCLRSRLLELAESSRSCSGGHVTRSIDRGNDQ